METKKILIAGVASGIAGHVIHAASGGAIMARFYLLSSELWRPFSSDMILKLLAINVFVGIALAFVFNIFRTGIPGEGFKKGIVFGICIWAVSSIPGNAVRYVMMPISGYLALGETLEDLVVLLVQGGIIGRVLK